MKVVLSAVLALCAAALFGTSSVLQQEAARREQDLPLVGLGVLRRLLRRPRWLASVALSAFSFAVQAVALAFGPLGLVLPIAAMDLLFALPFLAHQRHLQPSPADWLASLLVAGGVAGFLALSPPTAGRPAPDPVQWLAVFVGVGGAVVVLLALALRPHSAQRAALLAAAGAVAFSLVDALTKAIVEAVAAHGVAGILSWEPLALLLVGLVAITLGQSAYRAGSLLVSLPIIDSVEPIGGVVIGVTAFGEQIGRSPAILALQLLAGMVAVVGMLALRRSPLISRT